MKNKDEIIKKLRSVQKKIINDVKKQIKNEENVDPHDVILWIKEDGHMYVGHLIPLKKYSTDWRQDRQEYSDIIDSWANNIYKRYFKGKISQNLIVGRNNYMKKSKLKQIIRQIITQQRKLSPLQKKYSQFFFNMMQQFGVKSPAQLSPQKKTQFFNRIKRQWKKEKKK